MEPPGESSNQAMTEKPLFTEKEERVLKTAWLCLKSGVPDVDIKRLTKLGGFNTEKTAVNTWAVIKRKLLSMDGSDGGFGDIEKSSKVAATPKKRGKMAMGAETEGGEVDETPKKRTRKPPSKKNKSASPEDTEMDVKEEAHSDAEM